VFGLNEQLAILDALGKETSPGLDALRAVFTSSQSVKVRSHKLDKLVHDGLKDEPTQSVAATAAAPAWDNDDGLRDNEPLRPVVVAPLAPVRMRLSKQLPEGASVRIRKQPTLESEAIGAADSTTLLVVTGQVEGPGGGAPAWYRVDFGDATGFVVTSAPGVAPLFEPAVDQPTAVAAAPANAARPLPPPARRRSSSSSPPPPQPQPLAVTQHNARDDEELERRLRAMEARQSALEACVAELQHEMRALKTLLRSV